MSVVSENELKNALDKANTASEDFGVRVESKSVKKRRTTPKKAVEKENNKNIESINEVMTLAQINELIRSVVNLVFVNTPNGVVFLPIYIDLMLAYWKVGYYFPSLETAQNGVDQFFVEWINGEYDICLEKLENNRQAKVIDKAIRDEIEFKKSQLQQPIVNSLTEFVNTASVLAKKYVDDIDNIGTKDIKGFLERFAEFVSENNTSTITDEVLKRHGASLPFPAANGEDIENTENKQSDTEQLRDMVGSLAGKFSEIK